MTTVVYSSIGQNQGSEAPKALLQAYHPPLPVRHRPFVQSKQKLPKANITQKNITPKKYHKMKVVLLIGPLFIAGPCLLYVQ